jgi:phenylalanyl-tRNA synthetase alpha chain
VNLLLRIVLRPIGRTLTSEQANAIRNTIYQAVHEGPVMELI